MDEDVRCPVCGDVTAYATEVQPVAAEDGGTRRWPATLACRHGCDQRDQEAWSAHVDAVRAQWLTVNGI
jgi:hypothetical protein